MRVLPGTDPAAVAEAAKVLRAGGLVAFPTETVYGLGANACDGKAVARIFDAKARPHFNPLISHVYDASEIQRLAVVSKLADRLAAAFWPGPLTLVLPRRPDCPISELTCAGLDTVALRVPAHPLARALLKAAGLPVAAPSANRSGRMSATTAADVAEELDGRIDLILDGGPCAIGVESTVVGLFDGRPVLLRPGGLALEDIEAVAGPLDSHLENDTAPVSPGQLLSHYAPDSRLRLGVERPEPGELFLGFGERDGDLNLSPSGDLREAAANLFAMLRALDRRGTASIAVAPIPRRGLGLAINDRLRRAAAPRP